MRKSRVIRAVTAITLLAGAGTLHAQDRTMDSTFAVRGTPQLSVSNFSGTISVRSWNRNQIRVQAEIEDGRSSVEMDQSASRVSVRTSSRRGRGEVTYTITVPQGTSIETTGISTDVDVSQVCGDVQVNTVSGDVTVACATNTRLQSVSGDISLTDSRGDAEISATSGDIMVRDARGNVTAQAVSGEVDLAGIQGSDVTAESVSGGILYVGALRDNGRYRFVSHSGEVEVRVQGTINATVSVSTFSGDFVPEFPVELQSGTRMGREWQFRLGNGSTRVRLESFSGSIYLKRAGGAARED